MNDNRQSQFGGEITADMAAIEVLLGTIDTVLGGAIGGASDIDGTMTRQLRYIDSP